MTYTVLDGIRVVTTRQPAALLMRNSWFGFRAQFTARAGRSYVVRLRAGDMNGNVVRRTLTLVCRRTATRRR
jgi:hypothetical protein